MARSIFILLVVLLLFWLFFMFKKEAPPSTQNHQNTVVKQTEQTKDGFSEWILYSENNGKFRVFFPTLPQYATQNILDPKTQQMRKYEMYIAETNNGSSFMVNTITYPEDADLSDKQKIYRDFVRELSSANTNNQVKNSKPTTFHSHEAFDFEMNLNGEAQMDSKLFLIGPTLYVLSKLSPAQQVEKKDYAFFVDSFELLNSMNTK